VGKLTVIKILKNWRNQTMNVLSLFDGMSCGQIALNRLGIKVDKYFASEIDPYAIKITQKNFPNTIQLGDVTKISVHDLPKLDLIIGGSPCQGFSTAGKELNFDDPRSKLFFEFVRVLRENNPGHFLLENVGMKKEYRDIITHEVNYEPVMINASLVSGQNRPRFYWSSMGITVPEDKGISAADVLGIKDAQIGQLQPYPRDYKKRGLKRVERIEYRTDGKSNAMLTNPMKNLLKTEEGYRKLTPEECEKLQTVPVGYTEGVSNTQRYRMIGNSWNVDVIAHIFRRLI
jgi:site-specific DNA-cytosine methylase